LASGRLGRVLYRIGCLVAFGWFLLLLAGYLSSTGPMPRGFWALMIAIGAGIWAAGSWGLRVPGPTPECLIGLGGWRPALPGAAGC
jgi:hypothetical protein